MLNFLAERRFNFIDSVSVAMSSIMWSAGQYLTAILVFITGFITSVVIERFTEVN